ncbi:MAG: DUF262 domain-containing HNH endonuclease family protein [Rhodobacteraceae bacterium]|nr:DUF262 domain-containing HNH endonuclease family protein [Paracoccaceae bacterium]
MSSPPSTTLLAYATPFADLFCKGQFTVPWHQRYYDWDASHVRALLNDLDEAIGEDRPCYFLGSIMLVPTATACWEVNDGQQRMITISLLCAGLCKRFADGHPGTQREAQALRMIFDLSERQVVSVADAENYTPRITPPENNQMQYKQMIRGHSIGTNGKLTTAWKVIEGFLGSVQNGPVQNTERWEHIFDFVRDRLEVACLEIPHNIDPNAIYETINSRGKQLDDLDRLRNFIYSHFNAETQRKKSVHDSLERIRTIFPAPQKATGYLRCRLQCHYGFLGASSFYREARLAIRSQWSGQTDDIFNLAQDITAQQDLELYRTITAANPSPTLVRAFKTASHTSTAARSIEHFLVELNAYSVTQPLIFAVLSKYLRESDEHKKRHVAQKVHKGLHRLTTFVMRTAFVAPKFEPSHFEKDFANMARTIATASTIDLDSFSEFLKGCDREAYGILNDKRFIELIKQGSMTGNPKIKKFLLGVNRHQRPESDIVDGVKCSVEHILPKAGQHHQTWQAFGGDAADWVHRIGNLTLMSPADNKPGGKYNSSFAMKKEIYRESSVAITRQLHKFNDWTPERITSRQARMAKIAAQVWTFE